MIDWLHGNNVGAFNILEWFGFAALVVLVLIIGALILKRLRHISISVEIRKRDGIPVSTPLPRGREKILVTDDDPVVLKAVTDLLQSLGYYVVPLASGEQTVDYMKTNSADLMLLDLIMVNGIDGIETYRRIKAIRPLQRAIMLSGYADPQRVAALRNLGVDHYLIKPISLPLLANAIRTELDRP